MNQKETLDRLNKEKDYEDRLVENLSNYFILSLDSIEEITQEQRARIREQLDLIVAESRNHAYLFGQLIQMVVDNGENNY